MSERIDRVRASLAKRNAAFAAIEQTKALDYSDDDLHELTSALIDAAPEMLMAVEEVAKLKDQRERLRKTLRDARVEIGRMATDGGGFSCDVVDDIDDLLAETAE